MQCTSGAHSGPFLFLLYVNIKYCSDLLKPKIFGDDMNLFFFAWQNRYLTFNCQERITKCKSMAHLSLVVKNK